MIRAIDLFCGIGGNSWGARESGIEIAAGFDIWQRAGDVYKTNFPEARFYLGDLSTYRHADILRMKDKIGEIDLLLASPECTSHSNARGANPKNEKSLRLSWNVWRFARVFRPRWMVIENVPAMQKWSRYAEFLRILREKGGYRCREHLLDASIFGVPQSRKRLYIVCDRDGEPPEEIAPLENQKALAIKDILKPNGTYSFSPVQKPGRAQKTLDRAQRGINALGAEASFLMVYYGSETQGGWQSLDEPLRTVTTRDRFALVQPDGKGGHEMRMLQPDELQAAMGFPPEYNLACETRSGKIHMLGNAVCPPVMQAIVHTLTQIR
jgi:DNA (cytosine-5)-methyltransferase 1